MDKTVEIVDVELAQTIGIKVKLSNSQNKNFAIISRLWKLFNAEIYKIKNRARQDKDWVKFGITYKSDNDYYYLAALPYNEEMSIPFNMTKAYITQGKYACFTHTGKIIQLKSTINNIYMNILPNSNYIPKVHLESKLIHFEKYDHRFNWNRIDSVIEIYVPIEMKE